ncbi:MAG: phosphate ABC transporter permease subunit PstC [Anaeromicrobium sp.]|jgi:phosphate transport system permease protein|uniref:phosphate ABC transporter permease subunit PstC n=1 Tax=Anaeromicrobium sp. TaxID=1929132 RepID=UPI0025EC945C|nr:phosphate ABC transporter permease subunit PstC [Anaeromicrobium sp.]MCT4593368.1 phosphate ABC transporter permease subunit PstC [Anaeromicrobium sp.]
MSEFIGRLVDRKIIKEKRIGIKRQDIIEYVFTNMFKFSAIVSILWIFIISGYIFVEGLPAIYEIGMKSFFLGGEWMPSADVYGIFPMIIGSILVTLLAILIGVPIGVCTAIYVGEVGNKKYARIVENIVELLSAIPSVVYGFFGLMVIVPLINDTLGGPGGGNSLLAGGIVLGIMILPTITRISESSIKAVPMAYKEGSLALGASYMETVFKVILPAAKSGILTSVILGIGRAVGETMAIILVAGNTPIIPKSIVAPVRTLTANIAIEMGYAFGLHQEALFATGAVLFMFIMLLNCLITFTVYRGEA